MRIGPPASCPATKRRSSSEGASAACRSSRPNTTGPADAALRRNDATDSSRRKRGPSESAGGESGGGGGSGRSAVGEEPPKLGKDRGQFGPFAAQLRSHRLGTVVADVRAQRLDPGPVGGCAAGLPAAADVHPRPALSRVATDLLGQPALADARLAGDEHEPSVTRERVLERFKERGELTLASDERVRRAFGFGLGRRAGVEGGVLAQDRLLEVAQLSSRLESEPVDERPACILVRRQRLRL